MLFAVSVIVILNINYRLIIFCKPVWFYIGVRDLGSTSSYLQMEVRSTDFAIIYERLKQQRSSYDILFADRTNMYQTFMKELHGTIQDLELSSTTPFQAGAVDDRKGRPQTSAGGRKVGREP